MSMSNKSGSKRKIKCYALSDMHKLAVNHGGECLAETYVSGEIHIPWRCKCGYEWKAQPKTVIKGHWCPKCGSGKASQGRKFSFKKIIEMVESRGGVIISTPADYRNKYSVLRIKCEDGHLFESKARNIRSGGWCPVHRTEEVPDTIPFASHKIMRDIRKERALLDKIANVGLPPLLENSKVIEVFDFLGDGSLPKEADVEINLKNAEGYYFDNLLEDGVFGKDNLLYQHGRLFSLDHNCEDCGNEMVLGPIFKGTTTFYCSSCGEPVQSIIFSIRWEAT